MLMCVCVLGVGDAEWLSSFGSQSDSCPRRLSIGGCEFRDDEEKGVNTHRHTHTHVQMVSASLVLSFRENGMHLVCGGSIAGSWAPCVPPEQILSSCLGFGLSGVKIFLMPNCSHAWWISFAASSSFPFLVIFGFCFGSCRCPLCSVYLSFVCCGFVIFVDMFFYKPLRVFISSQVYKLPFCPFYIQTKYFFVMQQELWIGFSNSKTFL